METNKEKPFEKLRKIKDGTGFEPETVKNWYVARAFVLELLADVAFAPNSKKHLHVVVDGNNSRMLAIVRQVALSAHYINFDEGYESKAPVNRTVITIVTTNTNIKEELEQEEYLCNLPKYCKFVTEDAKSDNEDSYIDIEIHIASETPHASDHEMLVCVSQKDVDSFFNAVGQESDIFTIDTRLAFYASQIYQLGIHIMNLPAEDINSMKRYRLALDAFQYTKLSMKADSLFDGEYENQQCILRENLSNVFCTDTFLSRVKSMSLCNITDEKDEEKMNIAFSKSEHARWVVEKLIMGYQPFDKQQRFKDERLSLNSDAKNAYRKELKRDEKAPAHIDLCSYNDLRRIDPDNMKYDSFLMLAIPKILEKVKTDD